MRSDTSALFNAEILRVLEVLPGELAVAPVQYLVVKFSSGDAYLSDRPYEYTAGLFCEPLVADWGTMTEALDVQKAVSGAGLPTRQQSLSIFNTSDTGWFASRFNSEYPENIEVDVYQILVGIPEHVLIGRMLLRGPISYGEASITMSFALVSVNQLIDPFIGTIDPVTKNFSPVIIGSVDGVIGTLYGVNPLAQLAGDIAIGAISIQADQDLLSADFTAPGTIEIDFDVIAYTGISGDTFTGVTGVTEAHDADQYITESGHDYIFAFGAGPVDQAGPVYINDEVYLGPHVIYPNLDPVQVSFTGGLPFIQDDQYDEYVEDLALETDNRDDWNELRDTAGPTSSNGNITLKGTTAAGGYDNFRCGYFNDFPALPVGAVVRSGSYIRVNCILQNWSGNSNVGAGYSATNWTILGVSIPQSTAELGYGYLDNNYYSTDRADFDPANNDISFNAYGYQILGTSFFSVWFSIRDIERHVEYGILKEGYPKKINYLDPKLNLVGAGGAAANPSDTVAQILTIKGEGPFIDPTSFATAWTWFDNNGYSFDGLIPGETRSSQALSDVLEQCRAYLVYNAGLIFLRVRLPADDLPLAYTSAAGNRQNRSIRVDRQPIADVVNSVSVRFSPDTVMSDWQGLVEDSNQDSIVSTIGLQEAVVDAYLIDDPAMAASLAAFIIADRSIPKQVITFTGYLDAFLLEREDKVAVETDYNNITRVEGVIKNITRLYGNKVNDTPNLYTLQVAAIISDVAGYIEVAESIAAPDAAFDTALAEGGESVAAPGESSGLAAEWTGFGRAKFGSFKFGK